MDRNDLRAVINYAARTAERITSSSAFLGIGCGWLSSPSTGSGDCSGSEGGENFTNGGIGGSAPLSRILLHRTLRKAREKSIGALG